MAVTIVPTPVSTAKIYPPQMGTAQPRYFANLTVAGWSAITSQQTATATVELTGGYANGTPFESDMNVVELRWDPRDANAWETYLVLLPGALVLNTNSHPALQVSILNTSGSSCTPATHQFVAAIW